MDRLFFVDQEPKTIEMSNLQDPNDFECECPQAVEEFTARLLEINFPFGLPSPHPQDKGELS